MADQDPQYNRHFILGQEVVTTEAYRRPGGGGSEDDIPQQDRHQHGNFLLRRIESLKPEAKEARREQEAAGVEKIGLAVEFESAPEIQLALESLSHEGHGIELLNVRYEGGRTSATVLVPDGKLEFFEKRILDYLDETQDNEKSGPSHSKLLNTIAEIRAAALKDFWTDTDDVFPTSETEEFWWEVWLAVRGNREATTKEFQRLAEKQGLKIADGEIQFPERTVLLIHGSAKQMKKSIRILNSIAELRRARKVAAFLVTLPLEVQQAPLNKLLGRLTTPSPEADVPYICLLDTGVNYGHPLIAKVLAEQDAHTVEPNWGTDDRAGHGTEMAGLAMAGDLTEALTSQGPIDIPHRLESVKLIPRERMGDTDEASYVYRMEQAVAQPETGMPERRRLFSMPVTAETSRDRGQPSAWSGALDRLAADAANESKTPRLFIVSAGNAERAGLMNYPESNTTDGIQDPGQSWNALTIGATTDIVWIAESEYADAQPIAPAGGLGPFSTTSSIWARQWPLKPDVLFEGGNIAKNDQGIVEPHSLLPVTTNWKPPESLFAVANATSAASALAANMAARLMAEYPELWPETIRALIVHSAEWSDAMRKQFLKRSPSKQDFVSLVRHCGFGIPDLTQAMWSVTNSLTMVSQAELQPFIKRTTEKISADGKPRKDTRVITREMQLHQLPWPLEALRDLGKTQVKMRVTLSYFIEPNPSRRGFPATRYCYESHGLRFDVKRPAETEDDFRARINAEVEKEEQGEKEGETKTRSSDTDWVIGSQGRHRGSLHSDIWEGSAVDLASRGVIGVYPVGGWWKRREKLERYDKTARYALVVSIQAPGVEVDLYAAVANKIATPVEVEV